MLLHRPKTEFGGSRGEILLSRSADLVSWSAPEQVLQPARTAPGGTRCGSASARRRFGPSTAGCSIYHGVKETVAATVYRVGLALLDLDEPTRVLHRAFRTGSSRRRPVRADGDVPNVVFPWSNPRTAASRLNLKQKPNVILTPLTARILTNT